MSTAWTMLVDAHWEYRLDLHDSTKALRISCFLTGAPFTAASLIVKLVNLLLYWSMRLGEARVIRKQSYGACNEHERCEIYILAATLMDL
jgi:hypothetical protein